jgi:hypothetical protein
MTEEKPEQSVEETAPKKHFIQVRGQEIEIGPSEPTQLAMMRLTANRLARLDPANTSNEEALRVYEKVIQIVTSILVNRDDRDWIEDLLLQKEMNLEEATEVMEQATAEWGKAGNREQRRAKASRKKAPAGKK